MWCTKTKNYKLKKITSQRNLRNANNREDCDQHITKTRPNDVNFSIAAKRARKKFGYSGDRPLNCVWRKGFI